uniref:Large ribosomal subunit protein eL24 n=1 Tax=Centropages tenuiremis TaxID=544689 RepID=A0A0U2VA16_9MAXI|nr:60S ribosomal protein L24 [Centropages tenuiremis]
MKLELCSFSGFKIYPGHGRTMVKADGKTYKFLSSKTQRAHDLKRNPRKITWTVLYRRKHKKGIEEDVTKKRTKRTQKFQRAVVGASLNDILAKRNQKPEVRKAQREQAVRAAKEAKKATKPAAKKAAPKDTKAQKNQQKATKNIAKSAPRVGGKR